MSVSDFTRLGLRPELLNCLRRHQFHHATAAQRLFIPTILRGDNLIGQAPTGSGKTLAYLLPLIQICLSQPRGRRLLAIVVTPTRELAQQVYWQMEAITGSMHIRSRYLIGGHAAKKQRALCHRGSNILITTPGRLRYFLEKDLLRCEQVKMIVLDEADALFEQEYQTTLSALQQRLPENTQSICLSASKVKPKQAFIVDTERPTRLLRISGAAPKIKQSFSNCQSRIEKTQCLHDWLASQDIEQAIVFTDTKRNVTRLHAYLAQQGFPCSQLHSDLTQQTRTKALIDMARQRHRILVTTELAARGIDLQAVSHVVNFDMPRSAESYRHRIGRTGRNGREGHAMTIVLPEEEAALQAILDKISDEEGD